MAPGIRWRLTIGIAAVLVVILLAIYIVLRLVLGEILTSDLDRNVSEASDQVRVNVDASSEASDEELRDIALQSDFPIAVYDPRGRIIGSSPPANGSLLSILSEEELRAVVADGAIVDRTVDLEGEEYKVRTQRLRHAGAVVGIAQVGQNAETINRVMDALTLALVGGGAAAVLIVLVLGYWLARSALKPVEEITQLAAEIEASDLTRRIDVVGKPAEVQRLADTFDAMLARLEDAFGQQRNFVMDVSHELRTPLTALRGNLDVMLMDPDLDAEIRGQMERMLEEVGRLIRLTSNLLYLAHAEAGREVAMRSVDLDALCLEVVHQSRNVRPDVTLRLGHEEQVAVSGDRDLLKQLILNLVDNGLKYTPAAGEVTLSLFHDGSGARVVVEDSGPGIPEDQAAHIFERFYRGTNHAGGGAGIGLAISRWIARAHGGDITFESLGGQGSRFTVALPLDSGEAAAQA